MYISVWQVESCLSGEMRQLGCVGECSLEAVHCLGKHLLQYSALNAESIIRQKTETYHVVQSLAITYNFIQKSL